MGVAKVERYYKQIQEKFPELSLKQIDKICKSGLRAFYNDTLYGADVLIKTNYFTMYAGKLFKNNELFMKYYLIKKKIKLRIKYRRNKIKYDGYYYFALSDEAFNDYLSQMSHHGQRRRLFTFKKIRLYKIAEECFMQKGYNHFFRLKYPTDVGFTFMKENYTTKDAEYIYKRKDKLTLEPISYEKRSH